MSEQQPEAPAVPGVTRWRTPRIAPGETREAIRLALGNLAEVGAWVRSHGQECHYDGTDLLIGSPGDYIRAVPGDWVIRNPDSYWGFGHDVMPGVAFTATYEPAAEEKTPAASPAPVAAIFDREALGRLVHDTRLACEEERAALEGRQKFNLKPWEQRTYEQQETDMRIAEAVAAAVLTSVLRSTEKTVLTENRSEGEAGRG